MAHPNVYTINELLESRKGLLLSIQSDIISKRSPSIDRIADARGGSGRAVDLLPLVLNLLDRHTGVLGSAVIWL